MKKIPSLFTLVAAVLAAASVFAETAAPATVKSDSGPRITAVPGVRGQALHFDSSEVYLRDPQWSQFDIDRDFTIALWVKPERWEHPGGLIATCPDTPEAREATQYVKNAVDRIVPCDETEGVGEQADWKQLKWELDPQVLLEYRRGIAERILKL